MNDNRTPLLGLITTIFAGWGVMEWTSFIVAVITGVFTVWSFIANRRDAAAQRLEQQKRTIIFQQLASQIVAGKHSASTITAVTEMMRQDNETSSR